MFYMWGEFEVYVLFSSSFPNLRERYEWQDQETGERYQLCDSPCSLAISRVKFVNQIVWVSCRESFEQSEILWSDSSHALAQCIPIDGQLHSWAPSRNPVWTPLIQNLF